MMNESLTRKQTTARRKTAEKRVRTAAMEAVDARDGACCRICGCSFSAFDLLRQPHHHHIIYRSRGGLDTPSNIVRICAHCHELVHRSGKLRLHGDANKLIVERFIDGEWNG